MVSKPTGCPKGRPRLLLGDDPERYFLTYYQANSLLEREKKGGMSSRQLALTMVAARYGQIEYDPQIPPDSVKFKYVKGHLLGSAGSDEPRNATAFHPRMDNLARKARQLFNYGSVETDDGKWFAHMTQAWVAALGCKPISAAYGLTLNSCMAISEVPFFHRALRPIIDSRFGSPVPYFTLPDFNPATPEFNPHDSVAVGKG
jgi:hypothetical protein